jgi:asparagine synthase (glutamine-hydrolysing)
MRNSLPPSVLRRPKTGFDIPIHEWFRGFLRPLLLETLSESAITESGLFHWPAVRRLIDEHLNRKANWGYQLWGLVTLILWMKRWNIEAPGVQSQARVQHGEFQAGEPQLGWQPAPYSARTSGAPLI